MTLAPNRGERPASGSRYWGIGLFVAMTMSSAARAELYQFDLRSRFESATDEGKHQTGLPGVTTVTPASTRASVEGDQRRPTLFLQPRIESALYLVGNINLAEDPEDEIDIAGVEAAPGFYASYLSPRADGYVDYSLIGRLFEDDDYNEISHRLTASGGYQVLPEWFRIEGQATYTDDILDPLRGYNYGGMGLFGGVNRTEVATASVSPIFRHDLRNVTLDARYTYGRVWYLDKPDTTDRPIYSLYKDDSIDQRALVSVTTREERYRATMRVFYEWRDSEFERTVPYRYERAGVDLGFRLNESVRVVADGGAESDLDESTTAGGLDATYWHAGMEWRPDGRTTLDARYGQRFFGDSWKVRFTRDTRYLTITLSYLEDPQVETRRIGINFDPGELPLPDLDQDLSGFTSYPYIQKTAMATLLAKGARTRVRLDVYDHERDYIRAFPPGTETQGVRLNAIRDIGNNLYAEFDSRYDDVVSGRRNFDLDDELSYHYYDWNVIGRVTWEVYRNFQTMAEAGYLNRSGDRNYDGQWIAFRLRYTF